MPYTFTRLPAVIDKSKSSVYKSASDVTSITSTNAIAGFISTNGVLGSVKRAMQAAKGGNYNLQLTKFKSAYTSSVKVLSIANAGQYDIFIVQYSSIGSVNWIARIGGATTDEPNGVSADSNGNITVTGQFNSSTLTIYDKNGDPYGTTLSNAGSNDTFIVQYSSAGLVNWVARIGGASADTGIDMSSDSNGNITVTGLFTSSTLTVYNKNGDPYGTTLSNAGSYDTFIVQYSSAGLVNWVARIGGTGGDMVADIATDSTGNITVTGQFNSSTLTIYDKNGDPYGTTLSNAGSYDTFIVQYSSAGLVNWVARIGGTGNDVASGVSTDSTGNITVTGYFTSSTLTVYNKNGDPYGTTLSNAGSNDIFIVQYSSAGLVNWVARIGGTGNEQSPDIATDSTGNITVTGLFTSSTLTVYNKNGDPYGTTLSNAGSNDTFIVQYSSAGLVNWVARIGGTGDDQPYGGIAVDSTGNITVTGYFTSSTLTVYNKNGDPYGTTLSNAGLFNTFIAQYSSAGLVNWVARIGGTGDDYSKGITIDSNRNITVVGSFSSPTLTIV